MWRGKCTHFWCTCISLLIIISLYQSADTESISLVQQHLSLLWFLESFDKYHFYMNRTKSKTHDHPTEQLLSSSENNRSHWYNIPSRAPNARPVSAPPLLMLPTAAIDEKISGAPLPKASRVTPCRIAVKEIPHSWYYVSKSCHAQKKQWS